MLMRVFWPKFSREALPADVRSLLLFGAPDANLTDESEVNQ